MAALDPAQGLRLATASAAQAHLLDPRTGGIDQAVAVAVERFIAAAQFEAVSRPLAPGRHQFAAIQAGGAEALG
jgi:hypothetical protein